MSELKRVERIESTPFQSPSHKNVHGWERVGSLTGGVLMVGKGLGRQDMNNVRAKIERAGEELSKLKTNAEVATETATVTGNDSLTSPKAGV
jgi:hypothetical protein